MFPSMSSCASTKPNSGRSTHFTFFGSQLVKKVFAFHQNGKISITLAPGQNGFLLYNWQSGFKLDSHLLEIWIKGCLTFPDFSCLTLGQNKFPVQPWHSPSCPPDSVIVSLRTTGCLLNIFLFTTQCCAKGDRRPWYERITNTLFYEFITRHAYELQMWKIRASPSQKWRIRTYLSPLKNSCESFTEARD